MFINSILFAVAAVATLNCITANELNQTESVVSVNKRFFGSLKHFFNPRTPHEGCLRTFREKMLDLTNKYRKTHHSPELVFNLDLNTMAQKWAEKLAKLDEGIRIKHEHEEKIRENTFFISYIETLGHECSST